MAPNNNAGKRVKGKQIFRPFIYGTTAKPFDDKLNPKPDGVPDNHTHSWEVFVKGVEDTDITYWLKRVQFKLHESIPNHIRMIDGVPGQPFVVKETGWGEFEIAIKLYYVNESSEKPQQLYHFLHLHPYGTEVDKSSMKDNNEVIAWAYEEQVFNEPYEAFYDILTSGALPDPNGGAASATNKGGKSGGKGGKGGKAAAAAAAVQPRRTEGGVLERSAMIPLLTRPGQHFSRETEQLEIKKLQAAQAMIAKMTKQLHEEIGEKEKRAAQLKAEAQADAN